MRAILTAPSKSLQSRLQAVLNARRFRTLRKIETVVSTPGYRQSYTGEVKLLALGLKLRYALRL